MSQTRSLRAALLAACGIFAAAAVSAQTPTGQTPTATPEDNPFSAAQSQAIDRMIRAYIIKHPDVLLEAQTVLDAQAETRRVDVIRKVLTDNKQLIYHDPELPFIGNPKGDVIVVEFFDYNCPYCRKAAPDLAKLVASDIETELGGNLIGPGLIRRSRQVEKGTMQFVVFSLPFRREDNV